MPALVGRSSYGARLRDHASPEFLWQRIWCQHIDLHAEQRAEFVSDRADVEQRRFRRRINQNVKIAGRFALRATEGLMGFYVISFLVGLE